MIKQYCSKQQENNSLLCDSYIRLLIITDQKHKINSWTEILREVKFISNYEIRDGIEKEEEADFCSKLKQYDLVIYDYHISLVNREKIEPEKVKKDLQWFLNLTVKITRILITNNLGDELVLSCLQSGINGYLLREQISLLPEIIAQALQDFIQKEKLTQQEIVKNLINKYKQDYALEDILNFAVKIMEEYLENEQVFFYIFEANNQTKTYFFPEKITPKNRESLKKICHFYQQTLEKDNSIFIDKLETNLPSNLTDFWENQEINNLLLTPLIWKNNYLGSIIISRKNSYQKWLFTELTFINLIKDELSYIIYEDQLKTSLQKNLEIIKSKQEAKLELFSHLTHELRTPLTGILGFSKMLNEQIYGELNPKQLQYVQGIKKSGEHLLELINDILDLSKIDAVKEELLIEKIAVEDICLASISMIQELANQKNLGLKLEISPEIDFCKCDQRRLKQILLNLLSNAIKFTETGNITLKITSEKDQILFSVIDTGIGIKTEEQAKLFQPFVQLKTPLHKQYKGTGLGLALSRKLAQLHGGDITLVSEVGKGSCFTVYLPH